MRLGVASDHAGFQYKTRVKAHLERLGHQVRDFGAWSEESVDYPDFIQPLALSVAAGEIERGIIFGGSGNGEAMTANRCRGVRGAVAWNVESARLSRAHNDANVLSIGQRLVPEDALLSIVDVWLETPFDAGRHAVRISKLDGLAAYAGAAGRPSPQPLVTVTDVEASSRWYQKLLGLASAHGGPAYERLMRGDRLVLQLHSFDAEHDHGPIGDRDDRPYGNGVLLWFEVDDFDAAVNRAVELDAEIVLPPHRNPPDGNGGPDHRECWIHDPDGYTVVIASPDGEASVRLKGA